MIRVTKFAHRQLVVLVTSILVLSSALDGCLLDCHGRQRDQDVHREYRAQEETGPAQQRLE